MFQDIMLTCIHQGKGIIVRPEPEPKETITQCHEPIPGVPNILDHISVLVAILNWQGRIIQVNKTCQHITGYSSGELLGCSFKDLFAVDIHYNLASLSQQEYTSFLLTKDKQKVLLSWKFSIALDGVGHTGMIVATGIDITKSHEVQEKLRYLSMHDPVTGLYSRAYFAEEMKRLDHSRHNPIGLIIGDMDGLKLVNDTLGHEAGDMALAAMAKLLREAFRKEDVVARIGGDEFAIILPHSSPTALAEACQRIQEKVKIYNASNVNWPLSISLGFAVKKDQERSMTDLFKEADNEMYKVKRGGGKARPYLLDKL